MYSYMDKGRNKIEERKGELPELESILIDFLIEQGVGRGHIDLWTVMKYGGKIRKRAEDNFKKEMKEYYEIELLRRKFNNEN